MSTVATLADAVVAELQAPPLGLAAERSDLPRRELGQLAELAITVVPKAREVRMIGRHVRQQDVQIDIAVQKRVPADDLPASDDLKALAEQVGEHFLSRAVGDGYVMAIAHDPIYAVEHLEQMQVFTSVVTLTIRLLQQH